MTPDLQPAYELLHEGTIALAAVEVNGMAVDVSYLESAIARTDRRVARLRDEFEESEVARVWRKAYRDRTNFESADQLADVLYNKIGIAPIGQTARKGRGRTDKEALEFTERPEVINYLRTRKLEGAKKQLQGIAREVVNGRIYAFFNLHNVTSYRGSCSDPNLQNKPNRDPETARLVRRALVASPGNQLVEIDFKGAEVCVGCAYHKDTNMIAYLEGKGDMHADAARDCFGLNGDVPKAVRQEAKGNFTFAGFYGSYWAQMAPRLWKASNSLVLATGEPLRDYLAQQGVTSLGPLEDRPIAGTFAAKVAAAEDKLWNTRFPGYRDWKKTFYDSYLRRGWFKTLSGFRESGYMNRKQVCNHPIQGSSFHCLLKVLSRVVNRELPRRKMKAKVVNQVHDSALGDVPPGEVAEYVSIWREAVAWLARDWPWLIVPLQIEVEAAPVGGSWADKEEYK